MQWFILVRMLAKLEKPIKKSIHAKKPGVLAKSGPVNMAVAGVRQGGRANALPKFSVGSEVI